MPPDSPIGELPAAYCCTRAPGDPSRIRTELDQLRLAVGEVEALANLVQGAFDCADRDGADSLVVARMGYVLGVLATSATAAVGKFERFQSSADRALRIAGTDLPALEQLVDSQIDLSLPRRFSAG